MRTILLSNHYDGAAKEILLHAVDGEFKVKILEEATKNCLLKHISDADYLLVSGRLKIDREILENAAKLRMIQRTGVGVDNMDLDAIEAAGIPLYINQGVNAGSVAEHTIMLMLALLKNTASVNSQVKNGIWKKQATGLTCHTIEGMTVGLVGLGNIGREVAKRLKAFGCKLIYYQRHRLDHSEEEKLQITYVPYEQLLKKADIVSLHCPYNEETGSIIRAHELRIMKPNAYLINTARGKLIDEEALVSKLRENKFRGVGLDVYANEPAMIQNPLFEYDRVICSPHIAGVTYEAFARMMHEAIDNIRRFDEGKFREIQDKLFLKESRHV